MKCGKIPKPKAQLEPAATLSETTPRILKAIALHGWEGEPNRHQNRRASSYVLSKAPIFFDHSYLLKSRDIEDSVLPEILLRRPEIAGYSLTVNEPADCPRGLHWCF